MKFNPKGLLATVAFGLALILSLDGELTLLDIALDVFLLFGVFIWLGEAWPTPTTLRRYLPWSRRRSR
jgi:hypothetical protein